MSMVKQVTSKKVWFSKNGYLSCNVDDSELTIARTNGG